MLPIHTIEHVQSLLAKKQRLNHRQIAKIAGCSKGSVDRIARGEIPTRRVRRVAIYRCQNCGNLVKLLPCLICAANHFRRATLLDGSPQTLEMAR
jgi:hypothetical protein